MDKVCVLCGLKARFKGARSVENKSTRIRKAQEQDGVRSQCVDEMLHIMYIITHTVTPTRWPSHSPANRASHSPVFVNGVIGCRGIDSLGPVRLHSDTRAPFVFGDKQREHNHKLQKLHTLHTLHKRKRRAQQKAVHAAQAA